MAKKDEHCKVCKVCKSGMVIFAIIFVILGLWLWKTPTIEGIAKALSVVLVVIGLKKLGCCCPCRGS